MKRHIILIAFAALTAAVLSFGCSDSGDVSGGEIPDVSGDYTVKTSTCPFTSAGGGFSVTQGQTNRESLAISLGTAPAQSDVLEKMHMDKMHMDKMMMKKGLEPDFYEVPAASGGSAKKASIISANVSAGGGLTAQVKYDDATYDCSGSFKIEGKLVDFNCNTGSTACSFSAEGAAGAMPDPSPAPLTCSEGSACPDGTECKDGVCVNIPAPGTKKVGDVCTATSECGANLLCTEGQCAWDPNFTIPFADNNLKKGINKALGKGEVTADITVSQCDSIPEDKLEYHPAFQNDDCENLPELKISSLEGLQYCTSIKELILDCNQISDIKPLSSITKLMSLDLWRNQISDIQPLSNLANLQKLNLSYNHISNISSLSGLTGLIELGLEGQTDKDGKLLLGSEEIKPLANMGPKGGKTGLQKLHLYSNKISDITPLSGLTGLTVLSLYYNQISDISPLSGLTELTDLDLRVNNINNIMPLSGLTGLTSLSLGNNKISSIKPLAGLTKLNYLDLQNNCMYNYSFLPSVSGLGSGDTVKISEFIISCDEAYPVGTKNNNICKAASKYVEDTLKAKGVNIINGGPSTAQCQ